MTTRETFILIVSYIFILNFSQPEDVIEYGNHLGFQSHQKIQFSKKISSNGHSCQVWIRHFGEIETDKLYLTSDKIIHVM
jgi:hypothetical protein